MHWLNQQLEQLERLAERHRELRKLAQAQTVTGSVADDARKKFFKALDKTTTQIQERPGIEACFVSHEGLVCNQAGDASNFEALAALAQSCLEAAGHASTKPLLGDMRQMVLVGETGKLALFCLGSVAIGIRCNNGVNLARALST